MAINEAIQHIEEIINNDSVCEKCKDEHKQLAYWLEEYQKLDCALDRACNRLKEMGYALKVVYNSDDFDYLNADEWRQKFLKE